MTFTSKNFGTKFNSGHQEVQDWLSNHAGEFPVELFRNIVEDISAAIEKFKTEKCALERLALKNTYQHVVTLLPCIDKESDAMFLYCALLKNPDKIKKLSDMIIPMASIAVDHTSKSHQPYHSFLFFLVHLVFIF